MTKKSKIFESEINIVKLNFPNIGIGFLDEKEVYIKNTIPGQNVLASIKKKKQKYEGKVVSLIKKADYEIDSECSLFSDCGGCTYQNISYEKELEFKKNIVLDLLHNEGIKNFEFLGIKPSPYKSSYRNKMEFSFGDTGEKGTLSLGMKKTNSYYEVVNASTCNIVNSDIRNVLSCVLDYFKNSGETFFHRKLHTGSLRHLLIRQAHFTGEMLIGIVTTSKLSTDLIKLKENLLALNLKGNIVSISHIINDSVSDVVKANEIKILFGSDYFKEKLLGLDFKISTFSFFQTNSPGAEVLYSQVLEFVKEKENNIVFDLYCGTGTIAQIVAKHSKKVIGIELIEEAVVSAKENAKLNNLHNVEFIAGDVLKVVDTLNENPDLIILDPPREGINPKAIRKIINFNAKRLIYISCKPSSLSKDLKVFMENGYDLKKVVCIDMFPRTYHVETIALLYKK